MLIRLAIISKLENLVLAVLIQLVNNAEAVATSSRPLKNDDVPPSQGSTASQPKASKAKRVPKPKRVVILMAGRG